MQLPDNIQDCHSLIQVLLSELEGIKSDLKKLKSENQELKSEIKELKSRLNKNSRNSSKPPSSDGYRKRSILPKEKKQSGGQPGHKGSTLNFSDEVDLFIAHAPAQCVCGHNLEGLEKELRQRRQVFDLPMPRLEIVEHQSLQCECPGCGTIVYGDFPKGVNAPVQYGSGVKAFVTLLNTQFHLSWQRITQLFSDLYGYKINSNTQLGALKKAYNLAERPVFKIQSALLASKLAHADESGLRVEGRLHWLQNLSNNLFTYVFCHKKRGSKALNDPVSITKNFSGTLIHDCYSSYFKLEQCRHALCGAHLLRELEGLIENGSQWAIVMQQYFITLYLKVQKGYQLNKRQRLWRDYDKLCIQADIEEPPPIKSKRGRPKKTKGRNLYERLIKHKEGFLLFALEPELVPFTNNQAERDIRPAKIKQKNAGSFRTKAGADRYARIYSLISTLRKHKMDVFKELKQLFEAKAINFELAT